MVLLTSQLPFYMKPTFWFSLISLTLSIYAAVSTWINRHRKPSIQLNWSSMLSNQINLSVNIYNGLSKPIALNKVNLNFYDKVFTAARWPVKLQGQGNSKVFATEFPVNIEPFKSCDIICAFQYLDKRVDLNTAHDFEFEFGHKPLTKSFNIKPIEITLDQQVLMLEKYMH
ncbi:MAG: hypothetical protein DUD32_05980 [Lactobacillus sp.]|nr:MAG: hypothetical protein DUD32_05980 [Lactobacillus sp.]